MARKFYQKFSGTDEEKVTLQNFLLFARSGADLDKLIKGVREIMKKDKTLSSELRSDLKLLKSLFEESLEDFENFDLYYILGQNANAAEYAKHVKVIYLCSVILDS